MRVLAVSGSLRRESHNTRLLQAAAGLLPEGVEFELYGELARVAPFNEDDEQDPPATVTAWREAIERADAVLFATPEYNSSIPGQLKNALDWASRPKATAALKNKPAAVIGASMSMFGAVWAQAELRKVLGASGARVLDEELPISGAHDAFDEQGRLAEPELQERLAEIVGALVELAEARESKRQAA